MNRTLIISIIAMKKHIFIFFALLVSSISLAQNNYKEGYIINNENDTIYGLIDFRTDQMNNKQCRFKLSQDEQSTTYYPGDILGYRFSNEGKYYISHEINIDGSPRKVFLEFMVQGIMNLYSYYDQQQYFFFENQDGSMEMITKNPDRIENLKLITDTKYKGALIYLFKDHSSLQKDAESSDFSQKSMIDITKKYHNEVCTTGEECIVFENKAPDKSGLRVKIGAYLGMQFFTYGFYNHVDDKFDNSSCLAPSIGGQLSFINPRWSESLSLVIDMSFSKFKKDNDKFIVMKENRANRIYSYEGYTFGAKAGFRYTYPKYRFKPNIEIGFSSLFFLDKSSKITFEYPDSNMAPTDYSMRHRFIGAYFSVGGSYDIYKKQSLFLLFSYDLFISNDKSQANSKDKFNIPQLKLGYNF